MTKTVYPSLYNVRTIDDLNEIEDDALERYNVPENWLMLELLGLTAVYEIINKPEETLTEPLSLPKRPSILDNVVSRSVPLFLRL
jgi:hypothetical protein